MAPETSRYPASSFVSARAQLAATLTGVTLEALRNEIDLAEQQAAHWSSATAAPVDRDRLFNEVVGSSYVTLRRFQNQDNHCKPRMEENTSSILHVRNWLGIILPLEILWSGILWTERAKLAGICAAR
ncbi:hypothetical protein [Bradyrhizobium sp. SEMIA]|uniref:hypothetical protein n=1 Tax=Bradyrhizobium sp. SEMIA TaxID=2597515 RepID=UPI00223FF17C|nr:hypothetical protein [Bradyrhizobium sp. SEMIA]